MASAHCPTSVVRHIRVSRVLLSGLAPGEAAGWCQSGQREVSHRRQRSSSSAQSALGMNDSASSDSRGPPRRAKEAGGFFPSASPVSVK